MATSQIRQRRVPTFPARHASPPDDNATLVRQIQQLRAELEASRRDNAQLRRALAHAHGENRRLAAALTPRPTYRDPRSHIRTMLRDPGSINP